MTSFWSVTQGPNETLESYIKRFTVTYSCVTNPNEELAIQAYIAGIADENVQLSLCGNDVGDMKSLINKAYKLFDTQEMNRNRTPRVHQNDQRRIDYDRGGRSSQRGRTDRRPDSSRQPVHRRFESYTPLTTERAQILNAIANEHYLIRLNPITHDLNVDKTRYYSFHKDYGHTTEDCHKLKDEIEFHVRRGMLKEYVQQSRSERH